MLPQVDRARIQLGLSPGSDPAVTLFDAVARLRTSNAEHAREAAAALAEIDGLRVVLGEARDALRDRERKVEELTEQLALVRAEEVVAPAPVDATEIAALRAKSMTSST